MAAASVAEHKCALNVHGIAHREALKALPFSGHPYQNLRSKPFDFAEFAPEWLAIRFFGSLFAIPDA